MVRLKLTTVGFNNGLYAISTIKNLTEHHIGYKYLDLHVEELNRTLLDILTKMEELYLSVGGNVFLDEEKEILYVIDTERTKPDVFRRGLYTTKDNCVEWDKLLR